MKYTSLLLVGIILNITSFAQSHTAHDAAMARFQRFYNSRMDDSIYKMFSSSWNKVPQERLWAKGECVRLQKDYGTIKSFTYIGEMDDDTTVKLYRVVTTKETYATGLSLEETGKLGTFRFKTSSPHINKLLKQSK